jgi:hypothetical protein
MRIQIRFRIRIPNTASKGEGWGGVQSTTAKNVLFFIYSSFMSTRELIFSLDLFALFLKWKSKCTVVLPAQQ